MNRLQINGFENDVYREIANLGFNSIDNAEKIVSFLRYNSNILSNDEFVEIKLIEPKTNPGMLGLIIMEKNLYINVKLSTLLIAALILDIHFTEGFAQLFLNLFGIGSRTITRFDEENGEKCIIIESLKNKTGSLNILQNYNGECSNKQLKCKFRKNNQCCCTKEDVNKIYETLIEYNMFKKEGDKYIYKW